MCELSCDGHLLSVDQIILVYLCGSFGELGLGSMLGECSTAECCCCCSVLMYLETMYSLKYVQLLLIMYQWSSKRRFQRKKKPTNHKWYGALPSSPITFGIRASMQMLARGQLRVPSPQSCPCLSQLWSWLPIMTGWLSSKPCFFQPPALGLQAHATKASMFGGSSSGPHAYVTST